MAQTLNTQFVNKKKLDMLATAIRDNAPFIKASEQKFPQSEMKGKKYGATVHTYLTDAGTVSDGIVANPDGIHEVELTAFVQTKNTAVETDLWENFNDIESFAKEVLKPRALKLARTIEKDVIDHNVFCSMQAVVAPKVGGVSSPTFEMLSEASSKLGELAVPGALVDFQSPTVYGKIANTGLAKFLPDDIQRDIYRNKYLGEYAGASCVEQVLMPIVKMSATMDTAPTITFTAVTDAASNIIGYTVGAITASSGKTLDEGAAYEVPGVYLLDESGMETDQPLVVIVHKKFTGKAAASAGQDNHGKLAESLGIEDLRVTAKGYSYGTPNVWVNAATFDSGSATTVVTLNPLLGASKNYQVGQVRTNDALVFDSYSFDDLPSSRTEDVGNDGPVTLRAMSFGDGLNGVKLTRIDAPFIATTFEPRRCVTTFVEL